MLCLIISHVLFVFCFVFFCFTFAGKSPPCTYLSNAIFDTLLCNTYTIMCVYVYDSNSQMMAYDHVCMFPKSLCE